ncbi:putative nucleoredoxin 1-1 [Apium graveolens]|uniref:putative nucleoredoxin 1-1 n=1 Tax=Apium graveolens TaxID=4045 RepID=UPI003D78C62B
MARGLRLGIVCSNKKKTKKINSNSNSNHYDDEGKKISKKKKKNDSDVKSPKQKRRRKSLRLNKCTSTVFDESFEIDMVTNKIKRRTHFDSTAYDEYYGLQSHDDGSFRKEILNMPAEPRPVIPPNTLNFSDLLFSEHRDFLVTYNDRDCQVQAKDLEGKVIVLHFVPLIPRKELNSVETASLVDIYNAIHPKGGFEVVFIGIKLAQYSNPEKLLKYYDNTFSTMPWPAIPFFDIKPPEYFTTNFRFRSHWLGTTYPFSVVIDPTGVVLRYGAGTAFCDYGAEAYPFSDQAIDFVKSQDKAALKNHPSITTLLTSPRRDYLINSKNQVVPVHTLEDKVVALYFYIDYDDDDQRQLTKELKMAHEQWAKEGNFEIVLVYIHKTTDSYIPPSEETFRHKFRDMPWLALPFRDPKCLTLQRIFKFPYETYGPWPDPSLLIVGPQGKFFEPCGADVLKDFGIVAYPFTRQRAAQLEAESIRKLDLSMFWDPDASFMQNNGTEVKLSQLVGKRIMVVIEGRAYVSNKFWQKLKARYLQLKDTDNEFEVICICERDGSPSPYGEHVISSCSWLRHPPICLGSNISKLLYRLSFMGKDAGLLAFDRDGRVVRRTVFPSIERGNMVFPFYGGGLEKDALRRLIKRYEWDLYFTC